MTFLAVSGWTMFAVMCAVVWANGKSHQRELQSRLNANIVWRNENKRLADLIDEKNADLIGCQAKLQKFARKQGKGGKYIGAAK